MNETISTDNEQLKSTRTYCTFRIDGLLFGVPVSKVQEVLRSQPTTKVPLAPSSVHGLMNLRGQIISALNVREKLGLVTDEDQESLNVVIRSDEGPISLLVDEIGDVIRVDENQFESVPDTIRGAQRELTLGAYKLQDELLLVLDADCVIASED